MTHNKQSVIVGDFNCPNTNWSTIYGGLERNRRLETLEDTLMTQMITKPTRKSNILDLVLVSDPDLLREGRVGKKLNGCDHHLTRFSLRTDQEHLENATKIPNYRKANFSLARELLLQSTWEGLNLALVDGALNSFKNKLLEVERTTVPMKTRRANNGVNSP